MHLKADQEKEVPLQPFQSQLVKYDALETGVNKTLQDTLGKGEHESFVNAEKYLQILIIVNQDNITEGLEYFDVQISLPKVGGYCNQPS